MKKSISKYISMCMAVIMSTSIALTSNTFASDIDNSVNSIQEMADDMGIQADVIEVSDYTTEEIFEKISSQSSVYEFLNKIELDGYELYESMAYQINDNLSSNEAYCLSSAYVNEAGEWVVAVFVYDAIANNIISVFSEKIDSNNQFINYYEYTGSLATVRDFNTLSFYCSLSGTVVCTVYAAMFYALPVVGLLVGFGCDAAFDMVCSVG